MKLDAAWLEANPNPNPSQEVSNHVQRYHVKSVWFSVFSGLFMTSFWTIEQLYILECGYCRVSDLELILVSTPSHDKSDSSHYNILHPLDTQCSSTRPKPDDKYDVMLGV